MKYQLQFRSYRNKTVMRWSWKKCVGILVVLVSVMPSFAAERRKFKPGFNVFSTRQDIELGWKAAAETERQFPVLKDERATAYIQNLGRKLVRYAPGKTDYPWRFKLVNDDAINAFALPGGFIYMNRGTISAAQNEGELAGVVAHEIGHVVMRHSTNRASKAVGAQASIAILGSLLRGGAMGQLVQMGISFGFDSVMLKYSRTAETQSDRMATYMLYDAGYDPRAMASFFGVLEKKYPWRASQFFSSHPNPGNRIKNVNAEIPRLGPGKSYRHDSRQFRDLKRRFRSMPYPKKSKPAAGGAAAGFSRKIRNRE